MECNYNNKGAHRVRVRVRVRVRLGSVGTKPAVSQITGRNLRYQHQRSRKQSTCADKKKSIRNSADWH